MTDTRHPKHVEFERRNKVITVDELIEFYSTKHTDDEFDSQFSGRVLGHDVMRDVLKKIFS